MNQPRIPAAAPPFWEKGRFTLVMYSTLLFGIAAHGYCYFNLTYSHDSLLVVQDGDAVSQISIGRFLLPVYLKLRGSLYAPWLTGLLSLLFLGIASYMIIRLLEIENKFLTVLCCGVMAVNSTLTLTNATYLKDADVYMLALLLGTAAVYFWARLPYGLFPAAAALCLSLALYQAFFQAALFLSMAVVIKIILEGADSKRILLTGAHAVASLLLGLVVYYIVLQAVLSITGIGLTNSYNGLSKLGQFGGVSQLLQLVRETYTQFEFHFTHPEIFHPRWMARLNRLLIAVSAVLLVLLAHAKKLKRTALVLLAAVILWMPFGVNITYFISQGVEHSLMRFSFCLLYVFAAMLLDRYWKYAMPGKKPALSHVLGWIIPGILLFFLCNSIIYANQVYLKKDLEYQSTLLVMTRIVDRIEQIDGYTAGETPVALVGTLSESVLSVPRDTFSHLEGLGLEYNLAVTYPTTYHWYFRQILAYPIALLSVEDCSRIAQQSTVIQMLAFPAPGSCVMEDGVVIVKLS